METLPNERIEAALPAALADAAPTTGPTRPTAIMTTDTVPKAASPPVKLGGKTVAVTGISKGAGMIRPNMATMLGFVATDAAIDAGAAAAARARGRRRVVQPHHDRRRHVDQRLVRADRHPCAPATRRSRASTAATGRALRDAVFDGRAPARAGDRPRRRRRHQVHHRPRRGRRERSRVPQGGLRDRAIRRSSRPRSSPATRTSAASWRRSATPASTTSTRPRSTSSSTTCMSSRAAAGARATARKTASAS